MLLIPVNINHSLSERESILREVEFTIPTMICFYQTKNKLLEITFLKDLSIYIQPNIRAK